MSQYHIVSYRYRLLTHVFHFPAVDDMSLTRMECWSGRAVAPQDRLPAPLEACVRAWLKLQALQVGRTLCPENPAFSAAAKIGSNGTSRVDLNRFFVGRQTARRPHHAACADRRTGPTCSPMRTMVIRIPELTGYGGVRRVAVSLPFAAQLIDGVKYMLPGDVKPPEGGTELRRARAPRGPTLRSLVRLALKCESAEEIGKRLKRRFDRSYQRRGITPPGHRNTAELDGLLVQDGHRRR